MGFIDGLRLLSSNLAERAITGPLDLDVLEHLGNPVEARQHHPATWYRDGQVFSSVTGPVDKPRKEGSVRKGVRE